MKIYHTILIGVVMIIGTAIIGLTMLLNIKINADNNAQCKKQLGNQWIYNADYRECLNSKGEARYVIKTVL